jgi:DNA repair protein RecO (recombination protein O)
VKGRLCCLKTGFLTNRFHLPLNIRAAGIQPLPPCHPFRILPGMEWRDQALVLSTRPYGETSVILEVFTPLHGRHAGVVRGGASRKLTPHLQPGSQLDATWRARLDDHLGGFTVEPVRARAGIMADRLALAGLNAICALLTVGLPEREPHAALYDATQTLLDALLGVPEWPQIYLRWEMGLLEELGFALQLDRCAVTGQTYDLAYVSPKTGRAVSHAAAGEWADKLLAMPDGFVKGRPVDLPAGLVITGHFLQRALAPVLNGRPLPEARTRLMILLART